MDSIHLLGRAVSGNRKPAGTENQGSVDRTGNEGYMFCNGGYILNFSLILALGLRPSFNVMADHTSGHATIELIGFCLSSLVEGLP